MISPDNTVLQWEYIAHVQIIWCCIYKVAIDWKYEWNKGLVLFTDKNSQGYLNIFCSFYTSFCDFLFLIQDFCHIFFSHIFFLAQGFLHICVFHIFFLVQGFPHICFFFHIFFFISDCPYICFFHILFFVQDFPNIFFFFIFSLWLRIFLIYIYIFTFFLILSSWLWISLISLYSSLQFFSGRWWYFREDTFFFLSLCNAFLMVLFALSVHFNFRNCTWN